MQEKKINNLILWARARVRLQRIAEGVVTGLVASLMVSLTILVLLKTGWIDVDAFWTYALSTLVFPAAGLVWAFWSRIDPNGLAMEIDESNSLHARLTSAYCFLKVPEADRTDFMKASIEESAQHLEGVKVAPATPFRVPVSSIALLIAVIAVAALIVLKPPTATGTMPVIVDPVVVNEVLSDDDLKLTREQYDKIKKDLEDSDDPDAVQLSAEMDQLISDLEERKINKEEFFSEVDEIKDKFFEPKNEEWKQILEEVADIEEELKKDKHTKDLAEALKSGDMDKAAKELEKLGEKIANGEISDRDIDKLAKRLEKLAKQFENEADKLAKLMEKKEKELQRLKKKLEEKKKDLSDAEKKRLSRLGKQLKELKKKKAAYDKSGKGKSLKKLSRAAKSGSEQIKKTKKRGKGAAKGKEAKAKAKKEFKQAMKAGAEESRNIGKKAKTGAAKDKAGEQLDRMKDRIRRQENKDQKAAAKKSDFNQRAAGKKPEDAKPGDQQAKEGQDGQKGQKGQKGQPGQDQPKGKQGEGEGKQASKSAGGQRGGEKDREVSDKKTQAAGEKEGGDSKADKGEAGDKDILGQGQGKGQGDRTLGKETGLKDKNVVDRKVEGRQGEGPSSSEIVEDAAKTGFASTGYKEAFENNEEVIEEVLEQEKIPPGYRFYIQRYFESIRPRE